MHGYTVNMHGDVTGNLICEHFDPRYKIPRWSVTREFSLDDQNNPDELIPPLKIYSLHFPFHTFFYQAGTTHGTVQAI